MQDYLMDEDNDLMFSGGDIAAGFADFQHQFLLLRSEKGSWKEFPTVGVGAASFLESEDNALFLAEIRRQFTADGAIVNKILVTDDLKIHIDARYNS